MKSLQTMTDLGTFIVAWGGVWSQEGCTYAPVCDWKVEVANGDTRKGYWQWAFDKLQERAHEPVH